MKTSLSPEEVDELVRLGHEAVGIEAAIEQFTVAWGNANIRGGRSKFDRFDSPVFEGLSARREYIRAQIMNIHRRHGGDEQ